MQLADKHYSNQNYSYTSVSRTVNCEARQAGTALAMVAITNMHANQEKEPIQPKETGIGDLKIAMPTP
jgi:hypothetical protein